MTVEGLAPVCTFLTLLRDPGKILLRAGLSSRSVPGSPVVVTGKGLLFTAGRWLLSFVSSVPGQQGVRSRGPRHRLPPRGSLQPLFLRPGQVKGAGARWAGGTEGPAGGPGGGERGPAGGVGAGAAPPPPAAGGPGAGGGAERRGEQRSGRRGERGRGPCPAPGSWAAPDGEPGPGGAAVRGGGGGGLRDCGREPGERR